MLTRSPQRSQSRSSRGTAALHIAELPPEHVTFARGVPVRTVARTVIDLSRILPFADGVVAGDAALHKKMTTLSELQAVLAYCGSLARSTQSETCHRVQRRAGRIGAGIDRRVAFHQGGLPPPQLQLHLNTCARATIASSCDDEDEVETVRGSDVVVEVDMLRPSAALVRMHDDK